MGGVVLEDGRAGDLMLCVAVTSRTTVNHNAAGVCPVLRPHPPPLPFWLFWPTFDESKEESMLAVSESKRYHRGSCASAWRIG